jgi:hypothetical protein
MCLMKEARWRRLNERERDRKGGAMREEARNRARSIWMTARSSTHWSAFDLSSIDARMAIAISGKKSIMRPQVMLLFFLYGQGCRCISSQWEGSARKVFSMEEAQR